MNSVNIVKFLYYLPIEPVCDVVCAHEDYELQLRTRVFSVLRVLRIHPIMSSLI
jgi:hypothetical protein